MSRNSDGCKETASYIMVFNTSLNDQILVNGLCQESTMVVKCRQVTPMVFNFSLKRPNFGQQFMLRFYNNCKVIQSYGNGCLD